MRIYPNLSASGKSAGAAGGSLVPGGEGAAVRQMLRVARHCRPRLTGRSSLHSRAARLYCIWKRASTDTWSSCRGFRVQGSLIAGAPRQTSQPSQRARGQGTDLELGARVAQRAGGQRSFRLEADRKELHRAQACSARAGTAAVVPECSGAPCRRVFKNPLGARLCPARGPPAARRSRS